MKVSKILALSAIAVCMITTTALAANSGNQSSETKGQKSTIERNFGGNRGMHGGENRNGFRGPGKGGEGFKNPFANLVTAGTITQEKADAIKTAMEAARETKKTMKEVLDGLVTAGTITQAEEDAIVKDMPTRAGKRGNPMENLVTAGTITQEKADTIKTAMEAARETKKTMKEVLDGLVTAGTITQAEEDAIVKTLPERSGKGRFGGKR